MRSGSKKKGVEGEINLNAWDIKESLSRLDRYVLNFLIYQEG